MTHLIGRSLLGHRVLGHPVGFVWAGKEITPGNQSQRKRKRDLWCHASHGIHHDRCELSVGFRKKAGTLFSPADDSSGKILLGGARMLRVGDGTFLAIANDITTMTMQTEKTVQLASP